MLSNFFSLRKPTATGIFEDRDIASLRNRLERTLFDARQDWAPGKSRQECLDRAQCSLRKGNNTEWVRSALDLATHTLFCTERILGTQQFGNSRATNLLRTIDFKHWDQLGTFLAEEYGGIVEELKLQLIAGSFVEAECIVSREIDGLIGPYRATQDIEARIRYDIAEKPRGFDIESLKNLAARYNHTPGTPVDELVELGLSNVIDLHSTDDICDEYQRIFVERRSEPCKAVQGIALFALSYKHEGRDLRISKESFLEVCNALKTRGFEKVQLWIDAVLKKSSDTWARRGLLPYTVLPIVIHNNEFYDKGKERIWLKLERVASSGRSGVLYTRPTEFDQMPLSNFVTGDSRDLVAGCILAEDYDPQSVTFTSDVTDLKAWATEHATVATFRSFLGISRMGNGGVSEDMKQECLYSSVLRYDEVMPQREVQYVAKNRASFPDNSMDRGYREVKSSGFARNERLMTYMCRLHGNLYRVRVSHGLGISVLRMSAVTGLKGRNHVARVHKTSEYEREHILHTLTDGLIRLGAKRQGSVWASAVGQRSGRGSIQGGVIFAVRNVLQLIWGHAQTGHDTIRLDAWEHWPEVFPGADVGMGG